MFSMTVKQRKHEEGGRTHHKSLLAYWMRSEGGGSQAGVVKRFPRSQSRSTSNREPSARIEGSKLRTTSASMVVESKARDADYGGRRDGLDYSESRWRDIEKTARR